jgi:hypothetical protein
MAITSLVPRQNGYRPDYLCLNADLSSLPTNISAGKVAYVTDTKAHYIFDGSAWRSWVYTR